MDKCDLCKCELPEEHDSTWQGPKGETIDIERTIDASILSETSLGEISICEKCYKKELLEYFTSDDLYEIHYEFGVDYHNRKNYTESIKAQLKALDIKRHPDALAALANSLDCIGETEKAMSYYKEALSINPNHSIAKNNLKAMNSKDKNR